MFFTAVIWGIGSLIINLLVARYRNISAILFWRYVTALVAFLTSALLIRSISFIQLKGIIKQPIAWGVALGLSIGTLYPLFMAFSHTAPGLVMLIWNLTPLLSMLVGKFVFDDRFNRTEVTSTITVAIASIALSMLRYPINSTSALGVLYALCSVGSYILSTSLTRVFIGSKYAEELNILSSITGLIGAAVIYVLSPNKIGLIRLVYLRDWRIWYLGIFSTMAAQVMATRATYLIDYSETMAYTYLQSLIVILLEPVTGMAFSALKPQEWFLIIVIIVAFIVQLKAARKEYPM